MLRHELAHVRRSDLRWLVATEGALALVWAHPFAILLRRRMARLREEACDDAVLASGMEPATYAAHLASFLTVSGPASRSLSLPAAERSGWSRRFRRLLDPRASRRPTRTWEIVGFSLASMMVVSLGTLCVGCAGSRGLQEQEMGAVPAEPILPPKLPSGSRMLNIELKVVETTVRTQDAAKLGFPEGFPTLMGRVLTQDESRKLFHHGHGEVTFVTSPKLKAKQGQELKIESARPVRYPVELLPNPRTGVMEPVVYEEQKVGVFLTVAARPTENPDLIHLRFRFELKEHEGNILYAPPGITQPVFHTRMISDEIEVVNGSYIIVGFKSPTQNLAGFVPEPSNEAKYDRWRREAGGEAYGRLAAVQVLVEEAKD